MRSEVRAEGLFASNEWLTLRKSEDLGEIDLEKVLQSV